MTKPQNAKPKDAGATKTAKTNGKVATNGSKEPVSNTKQQPVPKVAEIKKEETPVVEPVVKKEEVAASAPLTEDQLRESGNEAFKRGEFKKASNFYSEVIEKICEANLHTINPSSESQEFIRLMKANECLLKAYNNRTQCYLNLEKWASAVEDATKVLHANPTDIKARYRRSQASQHLKKYPDSLADAKFIISLDPKNPTFIEYIQKLNRTIENVAAEQRSTKTQTRKMLDFSMDNSNHEQRVSALNNLIVLARDDSGCNQMIMAGGLETFVKILENPDDQKKNDVILAVARVLSTMCKNSLKRSKTVFNQVQYELIAALISHEDHEISTAAALIIQNMILALTDLENKRAHVKRHSNPIEFSPEIQEYIDEIFRAIIMLIMDPKCSGVGRDNCIDLCLKYVDRAQGCGWTPRFIVFGIPKLLRVAATVPELNLPGSLPLTENTKMHVSCCLSQMYDDIHHDGEREKYNEVCETFINELLKSDVDKWGKLKAIAALGTVLQGPFEVGSAIIVKNSLINLMLDLADSDDVVQEKVAVEAVVYSASKKDKATGILSEGIDVLKKLYQSKNQQIKVRALVGLCKLASCKGSDVSIKLLADGSAEKLEKACRK